MRIPGNIRQQQQHRRQRQRQRQPEKKQRRKQPEAKNHNQQLTRAITNTPQVGLQEQQKQSKLVLLHEQQQQQHHKNNENLYQLKLRHRKRQWPAQQQRINKRQPLQTGASRAKQVQQHQHQQKQHFYTHNREEQQEYHPKACTQNQAQNQQRQRQPTKSQHQQQLPLSKQPAAAVATHLTLTTKPQRQPNTQPTQQSRKQQHPPHWRAQQSTPKPAQRQHNENRQIPTCTLPALFSTLDRRKPVVTVHCTQRTLRFYALLLVFTFCAMAPSSVDADWLMDCGDCHCKWNSGKKTADCKNLTLAAVPENLSSEVQVLDLSFNRIPYLEQNAFLNAQLHNLHKLYIRNSSLQKIDPRTFTQLEILIEVDLSNNLLRTLQPNLFARLVKVRALVLNGNLLEVLGDGVFQNLKYLHKVELKHNRLTRIGTQVFVNVPLLSQIYLDGNRLNFLRKESFETVKRLTALSLDQNPWNCTCELQVFRDFVLKRNLYTPPTACYYPEHLRGMLWVEDQPEAFACKPKIIYPARGASINTSKENVTLVCRVHASPNTLIAWDYNKQMYRANAGGTASQQQRVHIQLLRDEQSKEKEFGRDVFISRLTILGAEKSDEGIYTCLAENAGGKDAVQMSLLVQKPGARDYLLQGNMIIVISLMALGLLSVSVFLALVTCCIYKRFKALSPTHHRHPHHHLDVADQLTPGMEHGTTTVAGGTSVVLGVGSADDTSSVVSDYKHHVQKANANNVGEKVVRGKYTEVLKHGVAVMDGSGVGDGSMGGTVGSGQHADKTYLERSAEDTLHTKYAHRPAAAEINRMLTGTTTTLSGGGHNNSNSSGGGGKGTGKWCTDANGYGSELGVVGRVVTDYQPDLLPAYNNKANNGSQQGQLYSPIKATRTINLPEDQQQQPLSTGHAEKNKYNISAQEYLQSRYGTLANSHSNNNSSGHKSNEKATTKREAPAIPLTTSASLSHSGYANSTATATESGFSTLQRHTKSLALPHSRSQSNTATPTDPKTSSGYEYRQPPPPPYNATHRTASGLLRRTSCNDDGENSATKDQGYRDVTATEGANVRQTIVTASSSLNFLTTTGYTPQRQLL